MHVTSIKRTVVLVVVLLISTNCCISCTPTEEARPKLQVMCKSVPAALNYLDRFLADQMPLEEKCKRYAVILSLTAGGGLLHETTIEQLSAVPENIVNKHRQNMDSKKLSVLLMCAIDNYRISQLAPPVLNLIECLKQIDGKTVAKYLNNDELKMTMHLYQQVLESPDKQIDLNNFDLSKFHTAFQANLRVILRGHLKGEHYISNQELSQSLRPPDTLILPFEGDKRQGPKSSSTGSSSSKNRRQKRAKYPSEEAKLRSNLHKQRQKILQILQVELGQPEHEPVPAATPAAATQNPKAARLGRPLVIDKHDLEGRRKRRRMQAQERVRRKLLEDPVRYREQSRLKQRRRRLLNPPDRGQREADRLRRIQRRRAKQAEQSRRLEQKMQLQSQLQQPQVQQKYKQQQSMKNFAVWDPPDLMAEMWPELGPSGKSVAMPDLFTPPLCQGQFITQQQLGQPQQREQYQLPQSPSEPGLIIDELLGEPAPHQYMLDLEPWQLESEPMQSWTRSIVEPVKAPLRTFPLSVHPEAAYSFFGSHGQTGACQNQTRIESSLRNRESRFEDMFLASILMPTQEECHKAGDDQAAGGQADLDRESVHLETILHQSPSVGNPLPESNNLILEIHGINFNGKERGL